MMIHSTTRALLATLLLLTGCSPAAENTTADNPPPPTGPVAIAGESKTHDVRGEYRPIDLERVEGLALENGKVLVRGPAGSVPLDMPASADTSRPNRQWVLVSEADTGGRRIVNFTHEESVEDFTLDLPAGDSELRYGAFSAREGGDVMVFAWADDSQAYSGYVTIARR
jgi:hypothetical protein